MAKTLSTLRNAFAQRPDSGARRPQAKPSGEIPRKDSTRALDKLGEIRLPRKLLRVHMIKKPRRSESHQDLSQNDWRRSFAAR
jgi:hypothetical protein